LFNQKKYLIAKFIDLTIAELKKKFLNEKSTLKRCGLIYFFSKFFFTDDVASKLRMRVICSEWEVFKEFIIEIKQHPKYIDFLIMIYQLFTESFIRFTLKSNPLALDYGSPDNEKDSYDSTSVTTFWNEIEREIMRLEHVDIAELKQLNEIRKVAIKPFENELPEKVSIDEVIDEFASFQQTVAKLKQSESTRVSRKEINQACKDFIKVAGSSSRSLQELSESDADLETLMSDVASSSARRKKLAKKRAKNKNNKTERKSQEVKTSSDESASEVELTPQQKALRKRGILTQNMEITRSVFEYPDKLKNCYE
jgi:hypothetical protein